MYKNVLVKRLSLFVLAFISFFIVLFSFCFPINTVKANSYQNDGYYIFDENDFWNKYYNSTNSIFFPTLSNDADSTYQEGLFLKDNGCLYVVPSNYEWATAVFSGSVELSAGTYTVYADVRTNSKSGSVHFGVYDATHNELHTARFLSSYEEWRTVYFTFTLKETSKVHIVSQLADTHADSLVEGDASGDLVDSINPVGGYETYCITTRGNIVEGNITSKSNVGDTLKKVGSILAFCLIVSIFCFVIYPYVKPLFSKKK